MAQGVLRGHGQSLDHGRFGQPETRDPIISNIPRI
jgi:hypothetical protein